MAPALSAGILIQTYKHLPGGTGCCNTNIWAHSVSAVLAAVENVYLFSCINIQVTCISLAYLFTDTVGPSKIAYYVSIF